jgi:transcription elongation GreA/GreB family factor
MMSVAFRRESDEEHKEPKFELPIPAGPNVVTARGLAQIRDQLTALDASLEQADEETARDMIKRDLRYWRTRLSTAQIAPPPPEGSVGFGSRVTFVLNGKTRVIEIVGDDESDPPNGRIGWSAPLARALIGAEVGEYVDFGGKDEAIKVVSTGSL